MNYLRNIILVMLILISLNGMAQDLPDREVCERLDSLVRLDVPAEAPGQALAVIINGKVAYQWLGGYARLDSMTKITERTRFNIASNGKQFTALAVLYLEDKEQLSLNDDIRKYFPELYTDISDPITLLNLLTHTSGIRDVYDLWSLLGFTWWEKTFSNQDVLNLIHQQETLNFKPGTTSSYSNTNYILLAEVVAQVTGKSFSDFTSELFSELGMPDTRFEDDHTTIDGPLALPYFNFSSWEGYDWIWDVTGDGNIFSSLKDQVYWEQILQSGDFSPAWKKIISKATSTVPGLPGDYGYGLEHGEYKGRHYSFHNGSTGAWKTSFVRFDSLTIIGMTNSGKSVPDWLVRQAADIIFGLENTVPGYPLAPAATGRFVSEQQVAGVYKTTSGYLFQFELREEEVWLIRPGRNDVLLERAGPNVFQEKNDPTFKQAFSRDSAGRMTVTAYHPTHAPYSLVREENNGNSYNPDALSGTFVNNETGTSFTLQAGVGSVVAIMFGGEEKTARLYTPTDLRFDSYRVDLSRLYEDIILLATPRSANIEFRRIE